MPISSINNNKLLGTYLGAQCFGGEIDSRVLHGLSVGRLNKQSPLYGSYLSSQKVANIWSNFDQYALPYPEIFKMDIMVGGLRPSNQFDAIVTDPPYGYRASARKAVNSNNLYEFIWFFMKKLQRGFIRKI